MRGSFVIGSGLKQIQQSFMGALIAGDIHSIEFSGIANSLFRSSSRLSATKRLSVYTRQYELRLIKALAIDFPRVKEEMGERLFEEVALKYVRDNPPRSPSLAYFGEKFPQFMRDKVPQETTLYNELALWEWAYYKARITPLRPQIVPSALSLSTDELALQPSVSLMTLHYDFSNGTLIPLELPAPIAVHRYQGKVFEKSLSPIAYSLLLQFKEGAFLEDACNYTAADFPTLLEDPTILTILFSEWSELGWFVQPTQNKVF
jgi:hypothetical protein